MNTQERRSLSKSVVSIVIAVIVVYQDETHSRSPLVGANLCVLLENHFKRNGTDKNMRITYLNSSKTIIENRNFHEKIDQVLQENGIKTVYGFKLDQLNVKNKELKKNDDSQIGVPELNKNKPSDN